MTALIGLSGYARSGKDTLAAVLVEKHGFERISFADPLREMLYALNPRIENGLRVQDYVDARGWEAVKVERPEVRALLQRLGTEAGRMVLGDDIWVETALRKVVPGRKYVFADTRFPNEAEAIVARGGTVWRITRPGFEPVNAHPSETALDDWPFDVKLRNAGSIDYLAELVSACLL